MKGELVGKITEFPALRPKKYSYLTEEKNENKNVKGTKSVSLNKKLNLGILNIAQKQLHLKIN